MIHIHFQNKLKNVPKHVTLDQFSLYTRLDSGTVMGQNGTLMNVINLNRPLMNLVTKNLAFSLVCYNVRHWLCKDVDTPEQLFTSVLAQ